MNKFELLHLHGLFACLAEDSLTRGNIAPEDLEAYHTLGVSPLAVGARRDDHRVAVQTLARAIADADPEARETGVSPARA